MFEKYLDWLVLVPSALHSTSSTACLSSHNKKYSIKGKSSLQYGDHPQEATCIQDHTDVLTLQINNIVLQRKKQPFLNYVYHKVLFPISTLLTGYKSDNKPACRVCNSSVFYKSNITEEGTFDSFSAILKCVAQNVLCISLASYMNRYLNHSK